MIDGFIACGKDTKKCQASCDECCLDKEKNKCWKYTGKSAKIVYYIMWVIASIAVIVIQFALDDCCSICDNDNDCQSCDASAGFALGLVGFGSIVDVVLFIHELCSGTLCA